MSILLLQEGTIFTTQTLLTSFTLPEDGVAAKACVVEQIDSARVSVNVAMYGFADKDLAQALLRAFQRGCQVWIILDHTEACTPTEVALLHWMIGAGFPVDHITIMTSPDRRIMHEKNILIDALTSPADASFTTLEAATAAGYPRLITGSTNWSEDAFFKQCNSLYVIPGKLVCETELASFQALWAWGRANELAYQLKAA